MTTFEIIGLMSGTSLDGLDIAHVSFNMDAEKGDSYKLLNSLAFDIPEDLRSKLTDAHNFSIPMICQLDKELGHFYGNCVNEFIKKFHIQRTDITAIASHGQTILHQPHNGFTLQIGCGTTLAFHTGINVINDFRSHDIVAGGQGAPLVPIGDFGLFKKEAEGFLNIGGFANMSYMKDGEIIAFDICPGNLPLNKLALAKGLSYDKNGDIAKSGEINFFLLDLLNSLAFYQKDGPKSLGTEWLEEHFYPLLKFDKEIENNLRTVVEHEAVQIGQKLNDAGVKNVLITGGGAKNEFLISRIAHYFNGEVKLPDNDTIDFKEAIVFAYLAALYLENRPNAISSVTGASRDMICGVLHRPGY
jgi:anhydro-N-acetylmuramic acid kinase